VAKAPQLGRPKTPSAASKSVEIGLVSGENHVELRVLQVEPRHFARVVVVAEQGLGAQMQKLPERRIVAECRG